MGQLGNLLDFESAFSILFVTMETYFSMILFSTVFKNLNFLKLNVRKQTLIKYSSRDQTILIPPDLILFGFFSSVRNTKLFQASSKSLFIA